MVKIDFDKQNPAEKTGYDMIYLIICSLHGIVPEQSKVEQMNLAALYNLSKKHGLTAMVCMPLDTVGVFSTSTDKDLVKKWKDAKEKAIRKNLMLDAERNEILSYMDREGIWYLPLKGILLKEMYPKLGMRQMADNDILYDKRYQQELMQFMTARGYEPSQIGKGNHDIYRKEPVYNFEMHTALYGAAHDKNWEAYYRNVKQRLRKDEGNRFGYHFREEDFYIYLLTHIYKHYRGSGTGIRSLLDIYVFLKDRRMKLNWHYIAVEMERLGISEFEQESRELCIRLFSKEQYPITQREREIVAYYHSSGTYGTIENNVEHKLRKYQSDNEPISAVTRLKYFYARLIPDMDYYKNYVPFVYRHKILIPFYILFRVLRGLLRHRKLIQNELQALNRIGR